MRVVGIDPSVSASAYCIYNDNKLFAYGKSKEGILFWHRLAKKADYVFIEDQYLGYNYQSSKKLTFSAGELSGVFKLAGAEVILVAPANWQTAVLGVSPHTKREQRKKVSRMVASDITKQTITDTDIADAICIAYWGLKVYLKTLQTNK